MIEEPSRYDWLTRIAFLLAVLLAVARAMTLTYLRDVLAVVPLGPGELAPPLFAGAATQVVLDSLCLMPALLVLGRWALDGSYRLARAWSVAALAPLAVWAFFSFAWSSDAYAAAVSASAWIAAAALMFALVNTTRSWADLRLCAALAAGLLWVNAAAGLFYLAVDHPQMLADLEENQEQMLAQQGLQPGEFRTEQFLGRLRRGEFSGFTASPNSYSATLALLSLVAAGAAWDRLRRSTVLTATDQLPVGGLTALGVLIAWIAAAPGVRAAVGDVGGWVILGVAGAFAIAAVFLALRKDDSAYAVVLLVGIVPAAFLIGWSQSRTALAAPVLAVFGLLLLWPVRGWLGRHRRTALATFAGLVMLGAALVIGYGLIFDTLPHVSLRFRWNYWTGAAGVFGENPLLGVGFANFGDAYLAHRVPAAAEEVSDPHNLIVRFFSETGIIGGGLALLWLALLAIDLTRPIPAETSDTKAGWQPTGPRTLKGVALLVAAAWALHMVAAVDFASPPDNVAYETLKRGLFGLVLLLATLLGVARHREDIHPEQSAGPALTAVIVAGLAAVLLHSMLDVVLFESSVLMVFTLLAGSLIGLRAEPGTRRIPAAGRAGIAVGGVLVAGAFVAWFALGVVLAESSAVAGDAQVRSNRVPQAVTSYLEAAEAAPVANANFVVRAAQMSANMGDVAQAEALYERAAELEPRSNQAPLALVALAERRGDLETAVARMSRVVAANPNELSLRRDYARLLADAGRPAEAAEQLRTLLDLNAQLAEDEPERLRGESLEVIQQRLAELEAASG